MTEYLRGKHERESDEVLWMESYELRGQRGTSITFSSAVRSYNGAAVERPGFRVSVLGPAVRVLRYVPIFIGIALFAFCGFWTQYRCDLWFPKI